MKNLIIVLLLLSGKVWAENETTTPEKKNLFEIGSTSLSGSIMKEFSKDTDRPTVQKLMIGANFLRNLGKKWSWATNLSFDSTEFISGEQRTTVQTNVFDALTGPIVSFGGREGAQTESFFIGAQFGLRQTRKETSIGYKEPTSTHSQAALAAGKRFLLFDNVTWNPEIRYQHVFDSARTRRVIINFAKIGIWF